MIIFPLFVNVVGYWISDNLLKKEVFEDDEESLKLSFYQSKTSKYQNTQQGSYSELQGIFNSMILIKKGREGNH